MSSGTLPTGSKTVRMHHFDILRAVLVLQVLPFHVAVMYAHGGEFPLASPNKDWIVTVFSRATGIFTMTGFFLISAFISVLYLKKRDAGKWMRMRAIRLGIPFLTGLAILGPLTVFGTSLAASQGNLMALNWANGRWPQDLWDAKTQWVGHLWFLPTLLIYTLVVWRLSHAGTLRSALDAIAGRLLALPGPMSAWAIVLVLAGGWRVASSGFIWSMDRLFGLNFPLALVIDLGNWLLYLPPFVLGLTLAHSEALREWLFRLSLPRIIATAIGVAVLVVVHEPEWLVGAGLHRFLKGATAVAIVLLIIGWTQGRVGQAPGWAKYATRHAYSVYLFHYPIIVWLGLAFLYVEWLPIIEFLSIAFIAMGLSLALAEWTARSALLSLLFQGELERFKRRRDNRSGEDGRYYQ